MEDQVQQGVVTAVPNQSPVGLSPLQQQAVLYAGVSFAVCCGIVFVNSSPLVRNAGFFAKVAAILLGTGLATIGALIGNALRQAVAPDAVFTSGGFWSLLWTKVFWKWGPQTIGMLIGAFFGVAVVVK